MPKHFQFVICTRAGKRLVRNIVDFCDAHAQDVALRMLPKGETPAYLSCKPIPDIWNSTSRGKP